MVAGGEPAPPGPGRQGHFRRAFPAGKPFARTADKELAHAGHFHPDPGSLWINGKTCLACHREIPSGSLAVSFLHHVAK
jgi:hypothetical protein